ncbi:MAG: PH domain-containing protein [Methanomassiliicoccaceae archaeon]|nr:PH domain-containing protein [Methanomassiliicoccaceae archaeon]
MEYKRLDPISKRAMYLENVISAVILSVIIATAIIFSAEYIGDLSYFPLMEYAAIAMIALIVLYHSIEPIVFYNRYRYIITDDCIDVRRGVIIIRRTVVPIERVHQVEVTRGPILNAFGLAEVQVTTAGGVAKIQYQKLDEAEEVAERLNALINRMVRVMRNDE